eukprot:CAMPEP_0178460624 /NCGR_PEP_ID=MMETSP0689_2-20121128/48816_1 /TAXON_ID=160604 /ORGANISM="Amphidinium massartii, Strain CS-259" /LENGTH=49 /DNA_ID= /DNA_START= /DNA_END= /DNA_ORIENTATION=
MTPTAISGGKTVMDEVDELQADIELMASWVLRHTWRVSGCARKTVEKST